MNVNCRTYVLPRKFADHAAQSHGHESDIFRVPLPLSSVKAAHREAVWSRPSWRMVGTIKALLGPVGHDGCFVSGSGKGALEGVLRGSDKV